MPEIAAVAAAAAAETYRANGWTVGTYLRGTLIFRDGASRTDIVKVTAIGDSAVLERRVWGGISGNGRPTPGDAEYMVAEHRSHRDWHVVPVHELPEGIIIARVVANQKFGTLRLRDVKAGDRLIADGGYSCMKAGMVLVVEISPGGDLYVACERRRHYLDGQLDCDHRLIGLARAPEDVA